MDDLNKAPLQDEIPQAYEKAQALGAGVMLNACFGPDLSAMPRTGLASPISAFWLSEPGMGFRYDTD
ncbi:hypothetical protein [Pararhizobium sp. O133]|uniref:hypothetical protein n=1 Tax=Pararhizobium sp. O133 TaxID=3449278 RepID=UPI003F68647B